MLEEDEEPTLYRLPFRGGTLEVWSDTPAGKLAIIAQLSLADPRLDRFYMAAGVTLKDPDGRVVFPDGTQQKDPPEANPRAGEVPGEGPVALGQPESGDGPVAGGPGVSSPARDASPGPEETAEEGDVLDLFGVG